MSVIIRIISLANGDPNPLKGQYLRYYNLESNMGQGEFDATNEPLLALRFPTVKEAMELYKTQSITYPHRKWDNQPNRPLTKFTIEIIDLKELI